MKFKFLLPAILLALLPLSASAGLRLPGAMSDGMVLQQQSDACIWGWAPSGAEVTLNASWGCTASVKAGADGTWKAYLATPAAGYETRTISISCGGETVTLKDILVGEVWMACGQSNMEMPLQGFTNCPVEGAWEQITTADRWKGKIHYITIPITEDAYEPRDDVQAKWQQLDRQSAPFLSAAAYYFSKMLVESLDVPVGIICCSRGGSRVESWLPKDILDGYGEPSDPESIRTYQPGYKRALTYYNGMLYPVSRYTVKGFLWYQGESNEDVWWQYSARLQRMVEAWRELFAQGELPFYIVEVAPFDYGGIHGSRLREQQWKAADSIPGAAAISTNDLVYPDEIHQIHPRNKKDVGYRLAWLALGKTYGVFSTPADYPRFKSLSVDGNRAVVEIDNLRWYGYNRTSGIEGFELCGADGIFHPADVAVVNQKLVLTSPDVPNPVHVRYCFHDFCPGNLASAQGLPLVPFRTDDYDDR